MDGSKSVGKRNFYKIRLFLQDFLSRVDVGQSRLHVSVVQFSDTHTITVEVGLNQYTSVEDVVAAVAKIMYQGGKEADLFSALRRVNLMVRNLLIQGRTKIVSRFRLYHALPSPANMSLLNNF